MFRLAWTPPTLFNLNFGERKIWNENYLYFLKKKKKTNIQRPRQLILHPKDGTRLKGLLTRSTEGLSKYPHLVWGAPPGRSPTCSVMGLGRATWPSAHLLCDGSGATWPSAHLLCDGSGLGPPGRPPTCSVMGLKQQILLSLYQWRGHLSWPRLSHEAK